MPAFDMKDNKVVLSPSVTFDCVLSENMVSYMIFVTNLVLVSEQYMSKSQGLL